MKRNWMKKMTVTAALLFALAGCGTANTATEEASSISSTTTTSTTTSTTATATATETKATSTETGVTTEEEATSTEDSTILSGIEGSMLATSELFSDRDLEQTADLTDAVYKELVSNEDYTITEEGVYVLSGQVENVSIIIEAADDAKVQLVLDGVQITNSDSPAIYVKTADKVFVTLTDSENSLEVSGTYVSNDENNVDAVIYSKSDLVLNGLGSLEILSAEGNGVSAKDDLKITGGTYTVTSAGDGFEANDSVVIYDGDFTIVSNKDAIHSENEDDTSLGYVYIANGNFTIRSGDDAIHGTSILQIDNGTINIETCTEGIEATYVQINGGDISIYATDDGINATAKSSYDVTLEINGGTIDISMGSGDTDALDANGALYINGGTINITANSPFDADGATSLSDTASVTVNGTKVSEITTQHMGGGMGGPSGGTMGGGFGGGKRR